MIVIIVNINVIYVNNHESEMQSIHVRVFDERQGYNTDVIDVIITNTDFKKMDVIYLNQKKLFFDEEFFFLEKCALRRNASLSVKEIEGQVKVFAQSNTFVRSRGHFFFLHPSFFFSNPGLCGRVCILISFNRAA
jgi:hypothetical protein